MQDLTPSIIARRVVRSCDRGALATVARGGEGHPYVSLVLAAFDHQGSPLIFVSDLAEHTKNLVRDNRVSFLLEQTAGLEDPLSGSRVTLLGTIARSEDPHLRERFFRRHPHARRYDQAHDFALYKMQVSRIHLVAGFGQIHWIPGGDYLLDNSYALPLVEEEANIVEHMNTDHTEALSIYAALYTGREETGWMMTGIDPEGIDLRRRESVLRVPLERRVHDSQSARAVLIELLHTARKLETRNQYPSSSI